MCAATICCLCNFSLLSCLTNSVQSLYFYSVVNRGLSIKKVHNAAAVFFLLLRPLNVIEFTKLGMWTSELFSFKENSLELLSYLTPLTRLGTSLSWFNPLRLRPELWQEKCGNAMLLYFFIAEVLLFPWVKRILLHR